MRRRILTLTVVFALVAAGAAAVGTAGASQTTASEPAGQGQGAQATFDNQTSGGATVTVASVTVPEGGFVTIHDGTLTEGHTLASVRGSSAYLSAGTHENVTVTLDQPLSETGTLIAMPHHDTDGDRTYDFVSSGGEADGPYTDDDGIVVDTATVRASATVTFSAQNSTGSSVVVDRVELAEGGFVTAHDSTLLDGETFGSVRGTSAYLGPGVHEDVRIRLDEPLNDSDTIIAMPHRDTNGNEEYDFVTSEGAEDGPYTDDGGNIVLDPGKVSVSDRATATFDAQTSGGTLVVVESVFVPEGGFVTAHDSTLLDGETFGSVRGTSSYLEPGLHRNVHVRLDEPLNGSDTIIAMPHRDTNGNEEYDFVTSDGAEDGPYTDDDGNIVLDPGKVRVSARVAIDDQSSDGRTVTVHHADLSDGGFVTIHDASLAGGATFDSVRGTSAFLEPGSNTDVAITLDDPLTTSTRVFAMPHKDTNGNEEYDFLTSDGAEDGPYTADGAIVLDPAHVTVTSQVTFQPQETDGESLTVTSVTLHDGGFVTIHDATLLDGAVFDSVRGSSEYLAPGTHENVSVALDQPVQSDGTFIAMPHRDTNGNHEYDFLTSDGAADGPYVAAGGAVVAPATVDAPATAEVRIEDQSSNGETVTVATARLSEGGFVTIHDASLQEGATFDSVRGTSPYLEAGTHEDIPVSLSDPYDASGTVIAMPHLDTNGNQQYDFVDSQGAEDAPYTTVGGDIVLDAASLEVQSSDGGTPTDQRTPTDEETPTAGSGPGFGIGAALVALLAMALLARRS